MSSLLASTSPSRRLRRGLRRGLAFLVAGALTVSACTTSNSPSASTSGSGTLTIGIVPTNVPSSLDPSSTNGAANQYVYSLAYAPILHIGDNGAYEPALARSWKYVGTGNKEFQFTLRSDAKFSDGSPVNAAAVVKWLQYFQASGGPFATQMGEVQSITATDQYTVDIKLAAPNSGLEWMLSQTNGLGYVVSPAGLADKQKLATATFGAGPYMLDTADTIANSAYVYVPNPNYYDKSAVHYTKVVLKVIADQSTMLQALQSGQIQVALGDYTTANAAKTAGFNTVSGQTSWDGLVYLTLGKPGDPLNNASVRQAISYGIDRAKITTGLLGSYGTPTSEWVTTDGFDPSYQNHFNYDPAKAKQLLTSAGYPQGLTLTVYATSGRAQDGTPTTDMVNAVAQQLKQVGINLQVTTVPPSESITALLSGKYQLGAGYFGINPTQVYWNLFLSETGLLNPGHWSGYPQVLASYEQASAAADPKPDLIAITRRLTELAYPLPVYTPNSLVFAAKSVGGISYPILPNGVVNGTFPDPTEFHPQ